MSAVDPRLTFNAAIELPRFVVQVLCNFSGIVWKTEVLQALRESALVNTLELPPVDSLRDEVSYAVGALTTSRHMTNARKYPAFFATPAAQDAYVKFGFVKAQPDELVLKPIE